MKSLLWRLIYAVLAVALLFALVPLLLAFVGFPLGGAWPIIRICLAGIAVFYVLAGPDPRAPF